MDVKDERKKGRVMNDSSVFSLNILPLRLEKWERRADREDSELVWGHVTFEVPMRHPRRDVGVQGDT